MSDDIKLLKDHHLTVTPQRLEIVHLLSSYGHLNIDELYKLLQNNFPSISLATVYKNINLMLEKDFLSEVQLSNKKNVYELIKKYHSHVVCLKCDEVLDVSINTQELFDEVSQKSNFQLKTSNIVFNGICGACQ